MVEERNSRQKPKAGIRNCSRTVTKVFMGSAGITIDVLNDCMAVAGKGYTARSRGSFLENRIQKLILISRYVKTSEVAKPIF